MILVCAALFFLALTLANVLFWPGFGRRRPRSAASLTVAIPARNEEIHIGACLDAVLAQGDVVSEVIVCNDGSTDGTAQILERYAARDARIRVLYGRPLPAGWCGKNFACFQLGSAADGDWILFLDADARLSAGACERMLAEAGHRRLTFLSAWPGLQLDHFWEKLLMPMLNFSVFSLFPGPMSLFRGDPSLGLAHGACLMVRRDVYSALGGHAAVAGEIFEDTRLAQMWRMQNERGLCLDGRGVVTVRMYESFGEIWRGFRKNFYPAFRSDAYFAAFLLLHSGLYLAPFFLGAWRAGALVLLSRLLLLLRFRQPLWGVILHPLSEAILLGIGLASWRSCRSGRGVDWKGRQYLERRAA